MPNTPVLVREGASVFVRGTNATDEDANITRKLLTAVGSCDEITENHMDAVTALSGSGPAYVSIYTITHNIENKMAKSSGATIRLCAAQTGTSCL